jgi:hypothetical protein
LVFHVLFFIKKRKDTERIKMALTRVQKEESVKELVNKISEAQNIIV